MAVPDCPALHSSVDEESLIKIRVTRTKTSERSWKLNTELCCQKISYVDD